METRVQDYTIVPQIQVPAAETLVDLLQLRAGEQPDRKAYTFLTAGESDKQTLTFAELDQRARAIASLLESAKAHGQRVLLMHPPGLDYITGFMGCIDGSEAAVPVPPSRVTCKAQRLQMVAADSEA